MGGKEKENEVPAGSIGTDGRNGPENAINKSDPLPSVITCSQKSTLLSVLFILWSTSENQEGVSNVNKQV